ncbi:hypothetical protein V9T40_004272 [Parthenolecanium corni]|uniref:Uncharacterized protein n=1 Tax=Parthenolecanium corni TaxID=536013 RepID=A0AAN9TRN5_9HEMI
MADKPTEEQSTADPGQKFEKTAQELSEALTEIRNMDQDTPKDPSPSTLESAVSRPCFERRGRGCGQTSYSRRQSHHKDYLLGEEARK